MYLSQRNIYGSSRIGTENVNQVIASTLMANIDINSENDGNPNWFNNLVGDKRYELSNHLGNVLQVITDVKLEIETYATSGVFSHFSPDVVSQTQYFPFGMEIPNLSGTDEYRYGFNGMEKDDEIKGNGNSYDFGARLYDPRIGRWFKMDPKFAKYPEYSPYKAMKNNPIIFMDPDGEDEILVIKVHVGGNIYTFEKTIDNNIGMTDGVRIQNGAMPAYYAYYNYSSTYNVFVAEDGSLSYSYEGQTIRKDELVDKDHDFIFTGFVPSKGHKAWYSEVNFLGSGGKQKGGIRFTSKTGGGSTTKYEATGKGITSVEADKILQALGIGGAKGNTPSSATDWIKFITDSFQTGESVVEQIQDLGDLVDDASDGENTSTDSGGTNTDGGGNSNNGDQDTTIQINEYERNGAYTITHLKDTTVKKRDVHKVNQHRDYKR